MSRDPIRTAFIPGAGLGKRLRPLTDDCLFANSIWPEPELLGLVDDLTGRTGRNL